MNASNGVGRAVALLKSKIAPSGRRQAKRWMRLKGSMRRSSLERLQREDARRNREGNETGAWDCAYYNAQEPARSCGLPPKRRTEHTQHMMASEQDT